MHHTDRAGIRAALRAALSEILNKDLPELAEETRLLADLSLDSTNVIELLMELEDALGLQIDPDELAAEAFETVGTLTDYIEACLSDAREPAV
ncbi:MAG TPA: phosphopantetheine-binding protein [Rugosimonospora sp.]|nr:phosphopantetheine-binding protein [Rugosimonospora sp.]